MLIKLALFITLVVPVIISFVQIKGGAVFPLMLLYPLIAVFICGHLYGIACAYLISVFVSAFTIGLIRLGLGVAPALLMAANFNIAPLIMWAFNRSYNAQKLQSQERISRNQKKYQELLKEEKAINTHNADLERQVLELARLYEATKAMSSALGFRNIFQILKGILQKIFEFNQARLITVREEEASQKIVIDKVHSIRHTRRLAGIDEKKFLRLSTESAEVLKTAIFKDAETQPESKDRPDTIEPCDLDREIVERCSKETRPIVHGGRRPFVAAPLLCRNKLTGLLVAEDLPQKQTDRFLIVASQFGLELERIRLYEQVQQLAIMDGLTGTYVRRYLLERCRDELRRSIKHKLNLSCLIADIDHFKICNDKFGHLVGDVILREMAGVFKENVREVDFIGRYGGEEFCIILPDTPREGGVHVAERLRGAVQQHIFKAYDEKIKVTVSLGVSTFPEDASEISQLIDYADEAMYKAKAEGRNKVCAWKNA